MRQNVVVALLVLFGPFVVVAITWAVESFENRRTGKAIDRGGSCLGLVVWLASWLLFHKVVLELLMR